MTSNNDPWLWRAVLADGTVIDEVDEDAPDGRGFETVKRLVEVRQSPIAQIILMPTRERLRTHVAIASQGATLDVYRMRTITVSMETGEQMGQAEPVTRLHIAWPDGHATYTFLFADGSIVVSDDLNAV